MSYLYKTVCGCCQPTSNAESALSRAKIMASHISLRSTVKPRKISSNLHSHKGNSANSSRERVQTLQLLITDNLCQAPAGDE